MISNLLLQVLKHLMSTGNVLCSLDWILLGLGFARFWHGHLLPVQFHSIRIASVRRRCMFRFGPLIVMLRSEEHTSELQSHSDLVCRLLLEKKKYDYRLVPQEGATVES